MAVQNPFAATIEQQLASVLGDSSLESRAKGIVRANLGVFIDANAGVYEDALGYALERTLKGIRSGKSPLLRADTSNEDIIRMLLWRIGNYCRTRARRWGGGNEEKKIPPGVRQRVSLGDGENEERNFWDSVLETEFEEDKSKDYSKLDGLLSDKGLSQIEIDCLKAVANGDSYKAMADRWGGTADKYRKIVDRAKTKYGVTI